MTLGTSVTFSSTIQGGKLPYSYQWYLDGQPVSGATMSTWTFTPSTGGVYYVYLKVTDADPTMAQSETARLDVISNPVGGYSISLNRQSPIASIATYIALVSLFGATLSFTKRKRK
jgi:hypothetical protein